MERRGVVNPRVLLKKIKFLSDHKGMTSEYFDVPEKIYSVDIPEDTPRRRIWYSVKTKIAQEYLKDNDGIPLWGLPKISTLAIIPGFIRILSNRTGKWELKESSVDVVMRELEEGPKSTGELASAFGHVRKDLTTVVYELLDKKVITYDGEKFSLTGVKRRAKKKPVEVK